MPPDPKRSPLKKIVHAHGCVRCHTRYEDTCPDKVDGLCAACRGLRVYQLLIDTRRPRPCCLNARLVTKDQKKTYDLAGGHLWFICPTCSRTHPFDPRTTPDRIIHQGETP